MICAEKDFVFPEQVVRRPFLPQPDTSAPALDKTHARMREEQNAKRSLAAIGVVYKVLVILLIISRVISNIFIVVYRR